jgi:hypothetical protein
MIKEISLDGIYLPPMLGYILASAILWSVARYLLDKLGAYRFVWHPPLFNTALYVILLSACVAATL